MSGLYQEEVLPPPLITSIFTVVMAHGAEFSELFWERKTGVGLGMKDGKIGDIELRHSEGIGIRVIVNGLTGYAYTEDKSRESLLETAVAARSIAEKAELTIPRVGTRRVAEAFQFDQPAWDVEAQEKIELLNRAAEGAQSVVSSVLEQRISYFDYRQQVQIINSEGLWVSDERSILGLAVVLVGQQNGQREMVRRTIGGQRGVEDLVNYPPEKLGRQAGKALNRLLAASPAPAGDMPVVIGPGEGGVLIHEAIGHTLEGDRINKGSSYYTDKLDTVVANPLVSVYDDATLPRRQGAYHYDDEGTPAARTALIEAGRLKGFLETRLSAAQGKRPLTGNGRRESYRFPPIPRMSCTFIAPGSTSPSDIISSVKKGVYVQTIGGGRSDVAGGNFVFSAPEVFMIDNGRLANAIKGVTLIGMGKTILHDIEVVGDDFEFNPGGMSGYCGRAGQSVPVSFGQPTILVRRLTVG